MDALNEYIGIPFAPNGRSRDGVDCWGLVCMVYRDILGIELPDYVDVYSDNSFSSLRRVARTMARERVTWALVSHPQKYDIVLLRSGEYLWHVGMVIDKSRMIHALEWAAVCIEEFTNLYWKNRIVEFRRYVR